jgi:hypothetical protein
MLNCGIGAFFVAIFLSMSYIAARFHFCYQAHRGTHSNHPGGSMLEIRLRLGIQVEKDFRRIVKRYYQGNQEQAIRDAIRYFLGPFQVDRKQLRVVMTQIRKQMERFGKVDRTLEKKMKAILGRQLNIQKELTKRIAKHGMGGK